MAKMDLQDAYLSVPIAPEFYRFLRFSWNDKQYELKILPFGLSSAPRLFTKLMRPVIGILRGMGLRLVVYLDNILFMNVSEEGLRNDVHAALSLFLIPWALL